MFAFKERQVPMPLHWYRRIIAADKLLFSINVYFVCLREGMIRNFSPLLSSIPVAEIEPLVACPVTSVHRRHWRKLRHAAMARIVDLIPTMQPRLVLSAVGIAFPRAKGSWSGNVNCMPGFLDAALCQRHKPVTNWFGTENRLGPRSSIRGCRGRTYRQHVIS